MHNLGNTAQRHAATQILNRIMYEDHSPREILRIELESGQDLVLDESTPLPGPALLHAQITSIMAHCERDRICTLAIEGATLIGRK